MKILKIEKIQIFVINMLELIFDRYYRYFIIFKCILREREREREREERGRETSNI